MLLDLPEERLALLKQLKKEYRIFLFSNTNAIHLEAISNICQKHHAFSNLDHYFEKAYYSHLFGQRKPNPKAFQTILQENQLIANQTLFIDDSLQHVTGAKAIGLQTIYLEKDKTILDLFD